MKQRRQRIKRSEDNIRDLWDNVMEAWRAAIHGVAKSRT